MISNKIVVNYKVADLFAWYNFDIKFAMMFYIYVEKL